MIFRSNRHFYISLSIRARHDTLYMCVLSTDSYSFFSHRWFNRFFYRRVNIMIWHFQIPSHSNLKIFSFMACLTVGVALAPLCAQAQLGDEVPAVLLEDSAPERALDMAKDLSSEIAEQEKAIQNLLPENDIDVVPEPSPDIQEVAAPPAQPAEKDLAPADTSEGTPSLPEGQKEAQSEFDEDLFFDAEALVPMSDLARQGAPSKVDPVMNPGSRLIVTHKKFNAGSKEARLVAAERATKLGRYESALEIYEGLYSSNRRDPNILLGRASSLQRAGRVEEAINAYEELLKIRPRNVEARTNLQGLLGKRYPAVALRNLKELHEDNPGNAAIIAQLAVVEAQMGRYPEAIRYLGMAASMEPNNANHLFNMAVIADRAGDKKQAVRYYEEALEVDTLYGAGKSIPRETVFERLAQLR